MSENWSYIFPKCWTRCFFCQLGMRYNYDHDAAHHPTAASALPVNLPRLSTWKAPECRCLHGLHMKSKKGELGFCPTGLAMAPGLCWCLILPCKKKMFFETCWIEGCFFCDSTWVAFSCAHFGVDRSKSGLLTFTLGAGAQAVDGQNNYDTLCVVGVLPWKRLFCDDGSKETVEVQCPWRSHAEIHIWLKLYYPQPSTTSLFLTSATLSKMESWCSEGMTKKLIHPAVVSRPLCKHNPKILSKRETLQELWLLVEKMMGRLTCSVQKPRTNKTTFSHPGSRRWPDCPGNIRKRASWICKNRLWVPCLPSSNWVALHSLPKQNIAWPQVLLR